MRDLQHPKTGKVTTGTGVRDSSDLRDFRDVGPRKRHRELAGFVPGSRVPEVPEVPEVPGVPPHRPSVPLVFPPTRTAAARGNRVAARGGHRPNRPNRPSGQIPPPPCQPRAPRRHLLSLAVPSPGVRLVRLVRLVHLVRGGSWGFMGVTLPLTKTSFIA